MRSSYFPVVILGVLVAAIGCSRSGDPVAGKDSVGIDSADTDNGSSESRTITIGYSAMELTNPFFKVIANTMTDEATLHGYEVIVLSGDRDVKKQSDQVDEIIAKGARWRWTHRNRPTVVGSRSC